MPAPTIPRTAIPKFKRAELETANLCAQALWYGINFETGALNHVSDAYLMSRFAPNFYHYHQTKSKFQPDIFVLDVKELILACGIKMLFRGIAEMDLRKGINSLYKDVYPNFLAAQKTPTAVSTYQVAVQCLESLNKGLVVNAKSNRLNLASRILLFVSPNLHTFNMNNHIAKHFGLQSRPHHHYVEYFKLFSTGMVTNQTLLSKYKMLPARDGLDIVTWNEAARTDWWKRRVLDLAVLMHVRKHVVANPNLRSLIKRKIFEDSQIP